MSLDDMYIAWWKEQWVFWDVMCEMGGRMKTGDVRWKWNEMVEGR